LDATKSSDKFTAVSNNDADRAFEIPLHRLPNFKQLLEWCHYFMPLFP